MNKKASIPIIFWVIIAAIVLFVVIKYAGFLAIAPQQCYNYENALKVARQEELKTFNTLCVASETPFCKSGSLGNYEVICKGSWPVETSLGNTDPTTTNCLTRTDCYKLEGKKVEDGYFLPKKLVCIRRGTEGACKSQISQDDFEREGPCDVKLRFNPQSSWVSIKLDKYADRLAYFRGAEFAAPCDSNPAKNIFFDTGIYGLVKTSDNYKCVEFDWGGQFSKFGETFDYDKNQVGLYRSGDWTEVCEKTGTIIEPEPEPTTPTIPTTPIEPVVVVKVRGFWQKIWDWIRSLF